MRRLGSVLFWGFIGLSSFALFPLAVVIFCLTAPFDRRRWVLHRFTSIWASLYTWLNPAWPVKVHGRERMHEASKTIDQGTCGYKPV